MDSSFVLAALMSPKLPKKKVPQKAAPSWGLDGDGRMTDGHGGGEQALIQLASSILVCLTHGIGHIMATEKVRMPAFDLGAFSITFRLVETRLLPMETVSSSKSMSSHIRAAISPRRKPRAAPSRIIR